MPMVPVRKVPDGSELSYPRVSYPEDRPRQLVWKFQISLASLRTNNQYWPRVGAL